MLQVSKGKRAAALVLALMFTMVTVFSAASVPTYAASKKPAKVTGVKAVAKSTSSIKITWKKAKKAKKYQVFRATSKNGTYKRIKTTKNRYFTDTKLKSGTKYYYKVRAKNGKKKGKFSAKKYAVTKKSSLAKVTVNTSAKTVSIYAKVNGKYFMKATNHFMVDQKGFNKDNCLLSSYCSPAALYAGLTKAGGVSWSKTAGKRLKNGEKITASNAENKNYTKVDITVSWGNESHPLSEVLTTKRGGKTAPKLDMVISGNPKAAAATPSGCMICTDSCYVAIVSNSKYGLETEESYLFGRSDVLPDDGKIVKVTFKLK